MSRIGRMPVPVPDGVQVTINGTEVTVKGPKGELTRRFRPEIEIKLEDGQIRVIRHSDERHHRALHGLTRALIANMVTGVTEGFQKVLWIEGTGYRAEQAGDKVIFYLGYSHTITVEPPPGIKFTVEERGRKVTVSGIDKEMVGQVAADIRKLRPPEPYKGKGIRYIDEVVRRKAGKGGKALR